MNRIKEASGARVIRAIVIIAAGSTSLASCSWLIDKERDQCASNADCAGFGANAVCDLDKKVCTGISDANTCTLVELPVRDDLPKNAGDQYSFTGVVGAHDYGGLLDGRGEVFDEFGYDIDGTCTTGPASSTCRPADWLTPYVADYAGGRDNAHANTEKAAKELLGIAILNSQIVTGAIRAGLIPPPGIVRVKRYSGKVFDDDLDVEWFAPVGMVPRDGDTKPRFDGTDEWIVSSESVVDASDPDPERWVAKYRATEAYVQQYTLVAKFDMPVQFVEVGLAMMVEGLTLVGKLVQDVVTKEYQFGDGTIVARFPAKRFVEFIPFAGTRLLGLPPICADDPQYFVYKETLCAANDVLLSGGVDPEAQCDAWSVMLRLVTTRARLGGVEDVPNYDDLCPADLSPVLDSCATQYGPFSPP